MRLIHVHIPRTGGTTFKRVMDQVYGPENIGYLRAPERQEKQSPLGLYVRDRNCEYHTNRTQFLLDWRDFREEMYEEEQKYQVFHGHTPLSLYPAYLLHNSFVVLWMRHPVSLQISWYLWDRAHRHLVDFEDIHDFVEQPSRRDIMTHMFYPIDVEFVGIYEFLYEDLARIGKLLRWPAVTIPHTNRNPSPLYWEEFRKLHSDYGLRQKILYLNRDDMDLYQYYLSRRIN